MSRIIFSSSTLPPRRDGNLFARAQGIATAVAAQYHYSRSVGFSVDAVSALFGDGGAAAAEDGRRVQAAAGTVMMDPLSSTWQEMVVKQGMARVARTAEFVQVRGVGASVSRRVDDGGVAITPDLALFYTAR
jgi:hypothetical protein